MASKRVVCAACKRIKVLPDEGRYIDGSWSQDKSIPPRYWNKWVCCHGCYNRLLEESRSAIKS